MSDQPKRVVESGEHRGMVLNPNVDFEPLRTPPAAPAVPNQPAFSDRLPFGWTGVSSAGVTWPTIAVEHPPPAPAPWRKRLRWRLSARWSRLRMRAGSWVAGVDLDRDRWED